MMVFLLLLILLLFLCVGPVLTTACVMAAGILLHYDTASLPTVLDVGSEIPPGVVRFLGTTMNGGWRNPAKHSLRTGVAVLAAGKWWDEVRGFA